MKKVSKKQVDRIIAEMATDGLDPKELSVVANAIAYAWRTTGVKDPKFGYAIKKKHVKKHLNAAKRAIVSLDTYRGLAKVEL